MGKICAKHLIKDVQPQLAPRPTDEDLRNMAREIEEKHNNTKTKTKSEEMSLSDVEKAYIRQLVDDAFKNINMENPDAFEYFKFHQLFNKPQIPTSACLDSIVSGVFVYSLKEIHGDLYILQGIVTATQVQYKRSATIEGRQNAGIDSVGITIRWFAGVPDYFIGHEIQATEFDNIHADNNLNEVFLTPEEAVSEYLNKKVCVLYKRLFEYQEARKNGRTVTF